VVNKVEIIIDVQEKLPLEFPSRQITTRTEHLGVGDYAVRINGKLDRVFIERKSIGDLFSSFSGESYNRERSKILRAKASSNTYILAIEASASEVRNGHAYKKDGQWVQCGKDGLSQVRQLMRVSQKYGVEIHYFMDRSDMAFWIQEYFLAIAKHKEKSND